MNITIINSMKRLFKAGKITKDDLTIRVQNGKLTKDEYKTITGEDYTE